jgi:RNA polymerase sigma-70 factor (ECF subfamily)
MHPAPRRSATIPPTIFLEFMPIRHRPPGGLSPDPKNRIEVTDSRGAGVCSCGGRVLEIEEQYRRYGPMVLRRCRQMLRDEQKALDAMQDVFVKLLAHQDRLTADAPAALLYRIATNVCLNRLRTDRRHPEDRQEELLHSIATLDDNESRSAARRFLERLFVREVDSTRTIAVLHLLDGMTLEEVAGEVGLSVSGVRKRLRTLRARGLQMETV